MDKTIIALEDYKGRFGSKHFDNPYRSGMDKKLLKKFFAKLGSDLLFVQFSDVDLRNGDYDDKMIIYTSSEDIGYHYKSYIEDIVYSLELSGAVLIPRFEYLRANNNKVFMEKLRDTKYKKAKLVAHSFGILEELQSKKDHLKYPCVLKQSAGASGRGVYLIKSYGELVKRTKKISRTRNIHNELWDYGRSLKHKGYKKESLFRGKFIVQNFVPNLKNDWKIYLFGERVYAFYRPLLKGRGIRASGGGYQNYFYGQNASVTDELLDFAKIIFDLFDVPHISIDVAFDGHFFYLLEFQALYFGTAGIPYSDGYFQKNSGNWVFTKEKLPLEKVYADSIVKYITK